MEVEILKEAVEYGQSRKWIAHAPLLPKDEIAMVSRTMGVSRAQLSRGINRSADWQDRRAVTGVMTKQTQKYCRLSLDIISDMPSYGYRRVWGILRKQRRTEDSHLNAKRLYRIMSEHNLLLLHHKPERPKREHKAR